MDVYKPVTFYDLDTSQNIQKIHVCIICTMFKYTTVIDKQRSKNPFQEFKMGLCFVVY